MRKWKLARLWTLLVCMALTLTLALAVAACGKQPTPADPGASVSAPSSQAKPLDALEAKATKTLRLAGLAYDSIMRAAGEAADSGTITPAQWDKVATGARAFHAVYHTARLALLEYHRAPGDPGSRDKLTGTLGNVLANWREFATYAAPLVGMAVPDIGKE